MNLIANLSHWTRQHLYMVSIALAATLLVVYGDNVIRWVRKRIRKFHFFMRAAIFITLCSALFPFLTLAGARLLRYWFSRLDNYALAPAVAAAFILLSIAAERERYI